MTPDSDILSTFIYALLDPETHEIRYVGASRQPQERYKGHLRPSMLRENNPKAEWLRDLVSRKLRPEIIILDTVNSLDWEEAERHWIAKLRAEGAPLTNITGGGNGILGLKKTPESVERTASKLRGRKRPRDIVERIANANRGKKATTEQRQHMSEAGKRRWQNLSEEQKQAHIARIPREWTPESRRKLSKANTGRKRYKDTTSKYVGVSWFKRDGCWRAYIVVNKRQVHLGYFTFEDEAGRAYDKAALETFGPEARLNFPGER